MVDWGRTYDFENAEFPAARLFTPFSALNVASMVIGAVVNAGSHQYEVALLFTLCGLVSLFNWLTMRRRALTLLSIHVLVGSLFVALAGANLLTGGFGLPAHFAIGLVPAAAVMMCGLSAGWPWVAAVVVEILAVAALHWFGVRFPAVPPADVAMPLQVAGAFVTSGATFLLAAVFAVDRKDRATRLAAALAEAKSIDRAKSMFLANVSHELRTPMNGVLGMLDAILASELQDEQRVDAEVARRSADNLLRLLNGLLDMTKLEISELELQREAVDPVALVRQVVLLNTPLAEEKGVALRLDAPSSGPGALLDPLRTSQIVVNLVSNALKFTDEGEVRVGVASTVVDGRVTVEIRVTDSGPGISTGDLERIFQPFAQADESPTRKRGGAGLGLTIARALCRVMDGDLQATSEPGRGSTFVATLRGAQKALDREPEPPADTVRLDGRRVLVAEDDAVNRIVIGRMLERRGATVRMATDGDEAVRIVGEEPFDLVLMDWHMPGLDGLEATRHIRAVPPAGPHLPIVALTASTMPGDRELCIAAGMDEFMSKPVQAAELDRVLLLVLSEEAPHPPTSRSTNERDRCGATHS